MTGNTLALVASVVASFVNVFFRGLQHKNVVGNHYKLTFVTAWLIAAMDVVVISLVVKAGWWTILTAGLGASLGMVSSMYIHNRFVTKDKT